MTMNDILTPAQSSASPTSCNFSATKHNSSAFEEGRTGAQPLRGISVCVDFVDSSVAPAGGSLGIYAKYSAIAGIRGSEGICPPASPLIIDKSTGEILEISANTKIKRFALQSVVRNILPKSRTSCCLRLRQKSKDIQVWRSVEFNSAAYAGLQTCGSVWTCPVCAAKIAERRRAEILTAMTAHKAAGGIVTMMTLTAPHTRFDKLVDILAKQAKALKYLNSDRSTRVIFSEMGIIGQIRALEVTHGRLSPINNGWHAHYHILQFSSPNPLKTCFSPMQLYEWAERLHVRWAACCVRAGLKAPSREHGIKLHDGSKAATYAAKWGLEDEMTKGHTKKALHGETPFDFLRAYLANPQDKQAAALFKEFAEAFKGKRQLHWSAGLKKLFKIGDFSDEELSVQMEDYAVLLGTLSVEQWRDVLRVEGRGILLLHASAGGWEAVQQYLNLITLKEISCASQSQPISQGKSAPVDTL